MQESVGAGFKRRKNKMFHSKNTSEWFTILPTTTESPKSVFHTDSQLRSLNLPSPFGHIYRNSAIACPYLTPSNLPAAWPHSTRESQIHSVPAAVARAAFLAFLPPPPNSRFHPAITLEKTLPVAPEKSSVRHLGEDLPHVAPVKATARRTGGPAVSTRAHCPERPPEDRPPSRKSCSLDASPSSRVPIRAPAAE
jgi:hypothetical protein